MQFRYVKSHVGCVVDSKGQDDRGRSIHVPCLLKNGNMNEALFRGVINADECDQHQRVKLVGFLEYSTDEGLTWIQFDMPCYLVGVRIWGEHYIVLYDGLPRAFPYQPKTSQRYENNVVYLPVNKP